MFVVDNYNIPNEYIQNITSFFVFDNGEKKVVEPTGESFNILKDEIINILKQSRIMPAFGVSLHNETLKEMKTGNWLQINFFNEMNVGGLSFNSLLVKLEKTNGVNLIRLFKNKYDGRCIFLDFENEIDLNEIIKILK